MSVECNGVEDQGASLRDRATAASQSNPQAVSSIAGIPSAEEAFDLLVPVTASPAEAFDIGWANALEAARTDFECRAWQIIDGDGLAPLPSDLWEALERLARAARNRDMWKAQCERQAEALASKFAVTDEMERAGVRHALSDSVHGSNGGWPGYVRRLWGAMNMARLASAIESRSGETAQQPRSGTDESAGPQDIAQPAASPTPEIHSQDHP